MHAKPRSAVPISRNTLMACALVVAVLAMAFVPTTYAYLVAQSSVVVNTFAGGAIALTLDEAPVDSDGQAVEGERVTGNTYHYVPGSLLDKDPTVTVLAGSEACYVFLYVDNPLPSAYFSLDYSARWTAVATSGTATLYVYEAAVDATDGDVELEAIFDQIQVSTSLTSEQVSELGQQTVVVQAYAVQAEGLTQSSASALAAAWFNEGYGTAFTVGTVEEEEEQASADELASAETSEEATEETEEADDGADVADDADEAANEAVAGEELASSSEDEQADDDADVADDADGAVEGSSVA